MPAPHKYTPLIIGEAEILPGRQTNVELKVARLPTGTWVSLPVAVLRGTLPGPRIWLSAAIHGDELNGIDIVRRVLPLIPLEHLRGTVIAVPIVNVFGFIAHGRYLPDRRDLNRSFPGSQKGSLAARLANLFMTQIVDQCSYGIDLHTGSHHRSNLPQIRADLDDPETLRLTEAFRAPLAINARAREGSLRAAATLRGRRVLLYEAGETMRFNRDAIRTGVRGVLRVLHRLRMIPSAPSSGGDRPTRFAQQTHWLRASRGGLLLLDVELGDTIIAGQVVAHITDSFAEADRAMVAPVSGIVIGLTTNPIVNRGDAVIHVARVDG